MDFDENCLLGKFPPSQLVSTPRSRRCKKGAKKAVCANDSGFIGLSSRLCVFHFFWQDTMHFLQEVTLYKQTDYPPSCNQ